MALVSDELAIPANIDTWRRLERAGEGATSVVWKAEHSVTGRIVALKVAKPGGENADEQKETGDLLVRALDEDRPSERKLFPPELEGVTW